MALTITESILNEAKALNAAGDVAGAYRVLASVGDNYSQNALVVIEEIDEPDSIFARIVQAHWDRVAPGARQTHFMEVGALHQLQYLQLIEDEIRDPNEQGESTYLLPNSIAIEDSYRRALVLSGLPPLTTVDAMFSLIDWNLERSDDGIYVSASESGIEDITWAWFLDPELESGRIAFDSYVFLEDGINAPITEVFKTVWFLLWDKKDIGAACGLASFFFETLGELAPQFFGFEDPQAVALSSSLLLAVDNGMTDNKLIRLLDALSIADATTEPHEIRDLQWLVRNLSQAILGNDPGSFDDKEVLFSAASALLNTFSADDALNYELIDLTEFSVNQLESLAAQEDDLGRAYRYALVNLQPFALLQQSGQTPAPDALGEDYDLDQFSEQYLHDRSLFLYTLNRFYLTDLSVNADRIIEFEDVDTDQLIMTQNAGDHVSQRYYFGDEQANNYAGGADHDHLYGGDGDDTLSGQVGNDYLEGNAGSDTLNGGEGNDTLRGGAGNDRDNGHGLFGGAGEDALYGEAGDDYLDGGADRDLLVGGLGRDELHGGDGIDILYGDNRFLDETTGLYDLVDDGESDRLEGGLGDDLYFAGNGDVINDADGSGTVCMNVTAGNGEQVYVMLGLHYLERTDNPNVYEEYNDYYDITLRYTLNDSTMTVTDSRSNNTITLQNFSDNRLGINIGAELNLPNWRDPRHISYWYDWYWQTEYSADDLYNVWWPSAQNLFEEAIHMLPRFIPISWEIVIGDGANIIEGNDSDEELSGSQDDDRIAGGRGEDLVFAGSGDDYLFGDQDNDRLRGDEGDDRLQGGDGNDNLDGGEGNDVLFGESGNDYLDGGVGADYLDGGEGNDTLIGHDGDTLIGGDGDDIYMYEQGDGNVLINNNDATQTSHDVLRIQGGIAPGDIIVSRLTDDLLLTVSATGETISIYNYFLDGGDSVYSLDIIEFVDGTRWDIDQVKAQVGQGTDGDDSLNGYATADNLDGGAGDDTLFGAEGDDVLVGGLGNDVLYGGDDNDQLTGDAGDDTLNGNAGDDVLNGGEGVDSLFGGDGDDQLRGNQGDGDRLNGGGGSDVYHYGIGDGDTIIDNYDTDESSLNTLRFMEGVDPDSVSIGRNNYDLLLTLNDGATITVTGYFLGAGTGEYALDAIEFFGGERWDLSYVLQHALQGTEGDDTLFGYEIADTIDGLGGNDTLMGMAGDDTLRGGSGNDLLYGGEGDDHLEGQDGDDQISGELGNDHLIGGAGRNTLFGGEGDDILECGRGSCSGGAGNDTYRHVAGSGNLSIHNDDPDGAGFDQLILEGVTPDAIIQVIRGRTNELELRYRIDGRTESVIVANYFSQDGTTGQAVDVIVFVDADVTWDIDYVMGLMQQGTEESDSLYATVEGSTLHGLGSNDNLYGSEGDDALYGDAGNDTLYGERGDDLLSGGQGNDRLWGGSGSDRYEFGLGDGNDRIYADTDASGLGDDNRLVFDEGITRDDLWFVWQADNSLLIEVAGDMDSVQLDGFFLSGGQQSVIQLELSDGTLISREEIVTALSTPTERDDSYRGTADNESVHLLEGDDLGYGGAGDDVLYGDQGDDNLHGETGNDHLLGGEGTDVLYGDEGDDSLDGGSGVDILFGGAGNDQLSGGAGDGDYLEGGTGSDLYLYTLGDGNTVINNQDASNDRNDVLRFSGDIEPDQVRIACFENDLILHLPDDSSIVVQDYFRGDHYQLNAIEFSDGTVWTAEDISAFPVRGTEGDDQLHAFPDGGVVEGLGGHDSLFGGDGDDRLFAGDGNDRVESAGGNDQLHGGDGNDVLSAGGGNDTLMGEAGNDTLWGGEGDDYLVGGSGSNTLEGHGGSDTYFIDASMSENYIRNGGNHNSAEDYDRVLFAEGISREDVIFSRSNYDLVITVGDSITTLESFFQIDENSRENNVDAFEFQGGLILTDEDVRRELETGNDSDQVIIGYDNYDDQLSGAGGDDTLYGLSGNDRLDGGVGNDRLEGGSGNDVYQFHQGDGQDLIVDTQGQNIVEFTDLSSTQVEARQSGNDLVLTALVGGGQVTVVGQFTDTNASTAAPTIQEIRFSDGVVWDQEDIYRQIASGTVGDDLLEGTDGDDIINARAGDDDVYANQGNDLVFCGVGNDGAMGSTGDDVLIGGSGSDLLYGQEGNDYLEGGAGDDILLGHQNPSGADPLQTAREALSAVEYDWTQISGVRDLHVSLSISTAEYDVLHGGEGEDWLAGQGELDGGSGNDRISGLGSLHGGAGDDVLGAAMASHWTYDNSAGAPAPYASYYTNVVDRTLLQGGRGDDTLSGNEWTTYVFEEGDGQDLISVYYSLEGGERVVEFRGDLTPSDVRFERQGSDVCIYYGDGDDSILIEEWFTPDEFYGVVIYPRKIDRFEFSDGSVITREEAEQGLRRASDGDEFTPEYPPEEDQVLNGTSGFDALTGGMGNDILNGQGGINHLNGSGGDDTLYAGTGISDLHGGEGNDTYIYNAGDGDVWIENHDLQGGRDVLRFGEGIAHEDLLLRRDRTNLIIEINQRTLTVVDYFQNQGVSDDTLNAIEFADLTSWTYDDVMAHLTLGTAQFDALYGDAVDDHFEGLAGDDTLFGADGADELLGGDGDDRIYGESGNDHLSGGAGADWLYAGLGADILNGDDGDDTLMGGAGNDQLAGGAGDDRYHYRLGDGQDVVDNTGGGTDRLCFTDLGGDRLDFHQDGNDLVIWVDHDPGQSVRITDQFMTGNAGIALIELVDGEVMTPEQILALVTPLPATEASGAENSGELAGMGEEALDMDSERTPVDENGIPEVAAPESDQGGVVDAIAVQPGGDDVLLGTEADEVLIAGAGDDRVSGGLGDDRLLGGEGNDVYVYSGGVDVLEETSGVDVLRFENGISFNQVASGLLKSGNDLILSVDGGPDQITLSNFFQGGDSLVESIEFATGGSVSAEEIYSVFGLTLLETSSNGFESTVNGTSGDDSLIGEAGNDLLEGGGGSDTLYGGAGDDRLVGGLGDDTYRFVSGDGRDVIDNSGGGFDTLAFEGIGFNEVATGLTRSGDHLVLQVSGTTDQVTLLNFFQGGDFAIDRLVFEGGSEISAEQIFSAFSEVNPDSQGSLDMPNLPDERQYSTQTLGDSNAYVYLGSSGSDFIDAGGGDDRIQANAGDDYMIGGRGSDLYLIGAEAGHDRINNYDGGDTGVDTLRFDDADYEALWLRRDGSDLCVMNTASGDTVTLEHWYDSADFEVERIEVGEAVLLNQQVDQLVAAMAAYDAPSGAGDVIPQEIRDELAPVLAESWQMTA
ncbi:MAG: calcium-binding protein [Candidatus Thiodiazotropha sp.]